MSKFAGFMKYSRKQTADYSRPFLHYDFQLNGFGIQGCYQMRLTSVLILSMAGAMEGAENRCFRLLM